VDLEIIRGTVKNDLPVLMKQIQRIIADLK